jgi:hypothetical protein
MAGEMPQKVSGMSKASLVVETWKTKPGSKAITALYCIALYSAGTVL